jgi:hypothetical protein
MSIASSFFTNELRPIKQSTPPQSGREVSEDHRWNPPPRQGRTRKAGASHSRYVRRRKFKFIPLRMLDGSRDREFARTHMHEAGGKSTPQWERGKARHGHVLDLPLSSCCVLPRDSLLFYHKMSRRVGAQAQQHRPQAQVEVRI